MAKTNNNGEYIRKYIKQIYSPEPLGIDLQKTVAYAKEKGCKLSELTEKEILQFSVK